MKALNLKAPEAEAFGKRTAITAPEWIIWTQRPLWS